MNEENSKSFARKAVSFVLITVTGGVALSALDDLAIYHGCSRYVLLHLELLSSFINLRTLLFQRWKTRLLHLAEQEIMFFYYVLLVLTVFNFSLVD